jgi:hypothetical protein
VGRQRLDTATAVALTARALTERRALDATAARWVTTAYATALGYNPPPAVAPPPPADAPPGGAADDRTPYLPTQPMSSVPQQIQQQVPQQSSQPQPQPQPLADAPTLIAPPGSGSLPPAGSSLPPGPAPGSGGFASTPGFGPQSAGQQSLPPQGFGLPGSGGVPGGGYTGGGPGGAYPGGGAPTAPPGPGYQPGGTGPKKRPTVLIVVAAAAAVVLIGYLALAGATHLPPFHTAAARHSPSPSTVVTSPAPTPTPTPSPTPTGPVLDPGVTPLLDILSTAIPDPATQCQPSSADSGKFTTVGVVSEYYCTDTNLPGGGIWAYQTDTQADYQSTWVNYNKWWGFSDSSAGNTCPPSGGGTGGLTQWHDTTAGYPDHTGQVLECQMVGSNGKNDQPSYTWSLPTQNTFFVAQGAKGSSWSSLNDWWTKDAPPQPSTAPSPTSS